MVSKAAIYDLVIVLGSVVCLAGVLTSFFVPWVRMNLVVDQGFYSVYIPLDIGLLKCFSDVCKAYYDMRDEQNAHRYLQTAPVIPPANKFFPGIEKKKIHEALQPFEWASRVTIVFLVISIFFAASLFLYILYLRVFLPLLEPESYDRLPDQSSHIEMSPSHHHSERSSEPQSEDNRLSTSSYQQTRAERGKLTLWERWERLETQRRRNVILVFSFFSAFFGLLAYLSFTWNSLHGGYYGEGVWLVTFTVMGGLVCALAAAIVLTDEQREQLRPRRSVETV